VNIPDDFDEPCFLDADEAPGDFQPPTPPPGYSWWRGWWPTYGLNSLDDLKLYVEGRLDQMIWQQDGPLSEYGFALAVQALKNADRYLGLHGDGDHPPRPGDDQLQHAEVVEDAMESVIRYLRSKQQPPPSAAPPTTPVTTTPAAGPSKRRWDKDSADAAIREYVAENAHRLAPLREGARTFQKAAIQAARAVIGRNQISRALGVSLGMVSKSAAWKEVAAEFNLPHDGPTLNKSRIIDFDAAVAEKAISEDDPVVAEVCRREAAEFIRSNLGKADASLLLDQLERGSISPEQAMDMARAMLEHKDDTRTAPRKHR
jgi:hypothetical protein